MLLDTLLKEKNKPIYIFGLPAKGGDNLRTLKFVVDKQILEKDPNCDFSGLIPGTEQYLRAEFIFSKEWNDCVKVASFSSNMGTEYPPQVLEDGISCLIPAEALKTQKFKVSVIGKCGDFKLTTNKVTICQNGGNV